MAEIAVKCPECGTEFSIESGVAACYCKRCDRKIVLDDNFVLDITDNIYKSTAEARSQLTSQIDRLYAQCEAMDLSVGWPVRIIEVALLAAAVLILIACISEPSRFFYGMGVFAFFMALLAGGAWYLDWAVRKKKLQIYQTKLTQIEFLDKKRSRMESSHDHEAADELDRKLMHQKIMAPKLHQSYIVHAAMFTLILIAVIRMLFARY